jgi:hypothetical protein
MDQQPQTLDEKRAWLSATLGREVTVSHIQFKGQPKFMADYVNPSAPVSQLVGDSEEEAIGALYVYVSRQAVSETPV